MVEESRYAHRNPILKRYHLRRLDTIVDRVRFVARTRGFRNSILLDVGCGDGTYELLLKGEYSYLIGLDVASGDLRRARDRTGCRQNIEFIMADIDYLPFGDLSVHVVLCSEVLEHLADPPRALSEVSRISSGSVLLTVPVLNVGRKIAGSLRYGRRLNEIEAAIGHVSMHEARWWTAEVEKIFGKRTMKYHVQNDYFYVMAALSTSILANVKSVALIKMADKALTVLERLLSRRGFANQLVITVTLE